MVKIIVDKFARKTVHLVHTKPFHGCHATAHAAYLIHICASWHGLGSALEAGVVCLSFVAIIGGGEA